MPQCLFLVPLAPRADLWIKILHDLTNLEALSPVNVSTPFFIWVRLLLHFFCYSDKHCYSFLTIIIPTEARNSLSGKRVRINLLSKHPGSQCVVPKLAVSASRGNLSDGQILRLHSPPTEAKIRGGASALGFNEPSRYFKAGKC